VFDNQSPFFENLMKKYFKAVVLLVRFFSVLYADEWSLNSSPGVDSKPTVVTALTPSDCSSPQMRAHVRSV